MLNQAKEFNEAVKLSGLILTKVCRVYTPLEGTRLDILSLPFGEAPTPVTLQ